MKKYVHSLIFLWLFLSLTGCQTPQALEPKPLPAALSAELANARALYNQGDLTQALIACVDMEHRHPNTPALTQLQSEIMTTLNERRINQAQLRRDDSMTRGMLESTEDATLPDTYGLRRYIQGNDSTHIRENAPMMALLDEELALHFDAVSLADIITYLGQERQINIIADPTLQTPPVTIHAEKITLNELFDYLSRNMNVSFHIGRGVIWVTEADEAMSTTPLVTRLYRMRNGLPTQYLTEDGAEADDMVILDAIERFVPLPEGADYLFDSNSQILLVKNTERNLHMVDQLVEALDVTPPQVLIEARFISTNISDFRELGIDWLLQSDVVTSDVNGQPRTQIDSGSTINFGETLNAGVGLTASFSGILTDPQYQAVLHALEIESDSRTLSAPKVIAVNNRPSFIRMGRDISYVSDITIEREIYGGGDTRDELLIRDPQVQILETGYELQATPSVGLNRRDINLRLRPEITELIRFREVTQTILNTNTNGTERSLQFDSFGGIEFPEVARSIIETEVVVQSGETVVMGGLMRHRDQEDVSGIPIISSIPFIGRLFTKTSVRQEKENLLIFVTATLISKRGEDLVPLNWAPPIESETRGRAIQNNGPMDESISE
jgi:type IV pilus assembly protein PilQ